MYPHAVGFENIVLRANVNSTTNNLDLLFLASNTPQLLQDQFSEVSLDGINGEHMGKWISLRGPMIRVLETCSVSFIIEERSTDLKNGILIANCILEPTVKQQPSLKCVFEGCGREFTRPFNLKSHLETHNPVRSRSHECPQCHAMFCRSQGTYWIDYRSCPTFSNSFSNNDFCMRRMPENVFKERCSQEAFTNL